ncbi:TadE/TadG family type IV pilus assembly protein [Methylocapsa sp. S129]|uniref:TadE/TadG family type IV pilus assembly protein n=1 Tax=Methylocapsa sp. S129 TaxID=1641869 RepID=UPI00131D9FDB|nr:TadE/TadG family type IV pilus assembly protein [Methylocapsa sp. S129]
MKQNFAARVENLRLAPRPVRAFARNARGVAAIEFALILPVMLLLLGLCVIAGEALAIGQQVTATARTIVDIVSKNSQLSTSQMALDLDAAAYTMAPYSNANLSMVVAEIQTNGSGAATVSWSTAAFNGTALVKGAPFTLPASMSVANATYIYGQASYAFTPLGIGFALSQPISLNDVAYFSPRVSTTINYPYPN